MTDEVGRKEDSAKLPWDLLPWTAVNDVVLVLKFGAARYAPENWRKVPDLRRRYFSALMRHLYAWLKGESVDQDSGLRHMSHVACNAMFLAEIELGGEAPDFTRNAPAWPTDPSSR